MRRPLYVLLAAIVLLVQWHLVMHVYQDHHHDHDEGGVCELCMVANLLHHAAPSAPPALPALPSSPDVFQPPATRAAASPGIVAYRVRAPPLALTCSQPTKSA